MNRGQRQVIAEKISSTVRVLELLELEYSVEPPKRKKENGNKSPRVVTVTLPDGKDVRVYNSAGGHTWAHWHDGKPIKNVRSVEDLYQALQTALDP